MSITHSSFLLISPSHPPPPLQFHNAKMSTTVHRFSHAPRRSHASPENGVVFLILRKSENYSVHGFEIMESLTGVGERVLEEVIGDHVFDEDAGNPPPWIDFAIGAEEDDAIRDKGGGYEMLLSVSDRGCLNLELEFGGRCANGDSVGPRWVKWLAVVGNAA
ncbi:hypothetical protein V8G54_037406 [Vigna mungo]|uniref:Uncharacterized protein n=1 Tax=Vigna mungo TaxID=3915 RepID=A0AAQ3MIU6_VIGMU